MYSKQGTNLHAPQLFTKDLPRLPLDGELLLEHTNLEKLLRILNAHGNNWEGVKYIVSDLPSNKEPYELRLATLKTLDFPSHVQVACVEQCRGQNHLQEYMGRKLAAGAEGILFQKPQAPYTVGRTSTIMEMKVLCYHLC
jgi:DNA ligase-1